MFEVHVILGSIDALPVCRELFSAVHFYLLKELEPTARYRLALVDTLAWVLLFRGT